jgi:hypothetical protein
MTALKEGQKVLVTNPRALEGTVVHQRLGDRDLPEDQRRYLVRISEEERYYRLGDLEEIPEAAPAKYGPEWVAALEQCVDTAKRVQANNKDAAALDEFLDAGRRIGFVKKLPTGGWPG